MPEGGLIPGGATPMNTTGMGNVDASHLDPQKRETVELLSKKKNKKKKHMKTLKEYIRKENVNESSIPMDADHKKVIVDILLAEYNKGTKELMTALTNTDDKWFDNLAKDYVSFVTGAFGKPDEKILKQVKDGITAFKASVKLGVKESVDESVKDDIKNILDDLYDVLLNNTDNCTLEEFRKKYIKNDAEIDLDNLWIKLNKDYGLKVIRMVD